MNIVLDIPKSNSYNSSIILRIEESPITWELFQVFLEKDLECSSMTRTYIIVEIEGICVGTLHMY